jgi:hypothetical protein
MGFDMVSPIDKVTLNIHSIYPNKTKIQEQTTVRVIKEDKKISYSRLRFLDLTQHDPAYTVPMIWMIF